MSVRNGGKRDDSQAKAVHVTLENGVVIVSGIKTLPRKRLKGVLSIEPEEENLIALLDEGKVDEFRNRIEARRLERRQQMFERVLSRG